MRFALPLRKPELGDKRPCFIGGCQAEWQAPPIPEARIVTAFDGG